MKTLHNKHKIPTPFRVLRLIDDEKGVRVDIKPTQNSTLSFKIVFECIYGYRNFDESYVYKYLCRKDIRSSGIYELTSSGFLSWAARENIFEELPEGVKHYMIASSDDIIEVLAFDPPVITRIIKEN